MRSNVKNLTLDLALDLAFNLYENVKENRNSVSTYLLSLLITSIYLGQ